MNKYLIIAGHGPRKDGSFDPGARGVITKGEHRYVKEDLFPAMKRFAGKDFIFFSDYNVYSYGNIVSLARRYGVNIKVVEIHYDSFNGQARGGHVIIHSDYSPDAMDLRLRDAINSMVGLRFSHKGQKGISGRANLANVNRTRRANVNYRMLELGFGDNTHDANILVNNVNDYAKKLVEAISGKHSLPSNPTQLAKPSVPAKPSQNIKKSVPDIAAEVIKGLWGNGNERFTKLKDAGFVPTAVQAEVNKQLKSGANPAPKPSLKSNTEIAKEVIAGKWGNGSDRTDRLKRAGYNTTSVQIEVNKILINDVKPKPAPKPSLKSNATIAKEVIAGNWGNGDARSERLKRAGYNPSTIQAEVNKQLGATSTSTKKSNATIAKEIYNGIGGWGSGSNRVDRLKKAGYNPQAVQKEVNKLF